MVYVDLYTPAAEAALLMAEAAAGKASEILEPTSLIVALVSRLEDLVVKVRRDAFAAPVALSRQGA